MQEVKVEFGFWQGFNFATGAVLAVSIIIFAGSFLPDWGGPPRDATDPPTGERSGLSLLIDHGTGCQYLATSDGGITERLDSMGNHIGCTSSVR